MPVSKKRKKSGKPVQRATTKAAPEAEGTEAKPGHPEKRAGKPSNPFVSQHQTPRSAQRGR
jgi:hypothetical protein